MIGEMKRILEMDFGKQGAFSEQRSTHNYSGHLRLSG